MEYLVRDVEPADLERLVILCGRHAEYEKATYNAAGKAEQMHHAFFSNPPVLFGLVVSIDNRIEGYATYTFDFSTWHAEKYMHLDCLYLEPAFRGLRIGEALLNKIQLLARTHRCVNVQWQTPIWNSRSMQFYERHGAVGHEKVRYTLEV